MSRVDGQAARGVRLAWGLFAAAICGGLTAHGHGQTVPQPGEINLEYSRVFVLVDRSTGLGHAHGVEGKLKSGRLSLREQQQGSLVFDLASFDADTPRAREYFGLEGVSDEGTRKKVNDNMHGREVLNVAAFPEAKLEKASLIASGKMTDRQVPEYWLEGDLTLGQTTRTIRARCEVDQENGWYHVRGSFPILQSDYGIKPFSRALGAIGVKDELLIVGDLWLVPEP